jgi:hypothetical protein
VRLAATSADIGDLSVATHVAALSATGAVTKADPSRATLECHGDTSIASPPVMQNPRLTAFRVDTLEGS